MRTFRKKFKTDKDETPYYRKAYIRRVSGNPWQWGGTIFIALGSRWFGISLAWPFFNIAGKDSPVRNALGIKHRLIWWNKRSSYWWPGSGWKTAAENDLRDYGCNFNFHIKDFSLGVSTDRGTWTVYLGLWSFGTRKIRWASGFNDEEFPTTEYGRFCLSLSKKELKQFLEVSKKLAGESALIDDDATQVWFNPNLDTINFKTHGQTVTVQR